MRADGTVVGWGYSRNAPEGLADAVQVAAGTEHSVALRADGTVVAWADGILIVGGDNLYGQATVPAGLTDVVQVAAGDYHNVALRADGTVVAWGSYSSGQTIVPEGLTDVVQVAAGHSHSLAVRANGTVVTWGADWYGQATVPEGLTDVVQVAAGEGHSVALRADGTVVAWGADWYGQTDVPAGLTDVVQVAAGTYHSVALRADGTVVAWKANWYDQIGAPEGLARVVQVAAGESRSVALVRGPAEPSPTRVVRAVSPSDAYRAGHLASFELDLEDGDGFPSGPADVYVSVSLDGALLHTETIIVPGSSTYEFEIPESASPGATLTAWFRPEKGDYRYALAAKVEVTIADAAPADPPSAASITGPADGAELSVSTDGTPTRIEWTASEYGGEGTVTYLWAASLTDAFAETVLTAETDSTAHEVSAAALDEALAAAGVGVGEPVTLYHRVVSRVAGSDGPLETAGPTATLRVTRVRSTSGEAGAAINAFALHGVYPNPTVGLARVAFDLPAPAEVTVEVYDVLGRAVLRVDGGAFAPGGGREVMLSGALPAGAYVYLLRAAYADGRADVVTGRLSVVR